MTSGSDGGSVHLWDAASAAPLPPLRAHAAGTGAAYRAVWSPAMALLVSCGEDGTLRTWSRRPY